MACKVCNNRESKCYDNPFVFEQPFFLLLFSNLLLHFDLFIIDDMHAFSDNKLKNT